MPISSFLPSIFTSSQTFIFRIYYKNHPLIVFNLTGCNATNNISNPLQYVKCFEQWLAFWVMTPNTVIRTYYSIVRIDNIFWKKKQILTSWKSCKHNLIQQVDKTYKTELFTTPLEAASQGYRLLLAKHFVTVFEAEPQGYSKILK